MTLATAAPGAATPRLATIARAPDLARGQVKSLRGRRALAAQPADPPE